MRAQEFICLLLFIFYYSHKDGIGFVVMCVRAMVPVHDAKTICVCFIKQQYRNYILNTCINIISIFFFLLYSPHIKCTTHIIYKLYRDGCVLIRR